MGGAVVDPPSPWLEPVRLGSRGPEEGESLISLAAASQICKEDRTYQVSRGTFLLSAEDAWGGRGLIEWWRLKLALAKIWLFFNLCFLRHGPEYGISLSRISNSGILIYFVSPSLFVLHFLNFFLEYGISLSRISNSGILIYFVSPSLFVLNFLNFFHWRRFLYFLHREIESKTYKIECIRKHDFLHTFIHTDLQSFHRYACEVGRFYVWRSFIHTAPPELRWVFYRSAENSVRDWEYGQLICKADFFMKINFRQPIGKGISYGTCRPPNPLVSRQSWAVGKRLKTLNCFKKSKKKKLTAMNALTLGL